MRDWTLPSYHHLGEQAEREAMNEQARRQAQVDQERAVVDTLKRLPEVIDE